MALPPCNRHETAAATASLAARVVLQEMCYRARARACVYRLRLRLRRCVAAVRAQWSHATHRVAAARLNAASPLLPCNRCPGDEVSPAELALVLTRANQRRCRLGRRAAISRAKRSRATRRVAAVRPSHNRCCPAEAGSGCRNREPSSRSCSSMSVGGADGSAAASPQAKRSSRAPRVVRLPCNRLVTAAALQPRVTADVSTSRGRARARA